MNPGEEARSASILQPTTLGSAREALLARRWDDEPHSVVSLSRIQHNKLVLPKHPEKSSRRLAIHSVSDRCGMLRPLQTAALEDRRLGQHQHSGIQRGLLRVPCESPRLSEKLLQRFRLHLVASVLFEGDRLRAQNGKRLQIIAVDGI